MSRFLVALALVAAPALAQPLAAAQPTAADSALVDRVLSAHGVFDAPLGDADDLRAAFFDDLDTDLLHEALAVLEGPIYAHLEGPPGDRLRPTDRDARHDSTLVADYVTARDQANNPPGVWRQALTEVRRALPDSTDRTLAKAGVWDTLSQPTPAELPAAIAISRQWLSAVPPFEIEALTAYYRSEAGRYVGRRISLGSTRHALRSSIASIVRALER